MRRLTAKKAEPKRPTPTGRPGARTATRLAAAAIMPAFLIYWIPSAHALSELQDRTSPPASSALSGSSPVFEVPLPGDGPPDADDGAGPQDKGDPSKVPATDIQRPDTSLGKDLPEVMYDVEALPEPVRRMRSLIIEACRSGDPEKLRPLIGTGGTRTRLSLGGLDEDPIAFLRELSGDDEGQEILAILLEVMQSGYVHLNAGEPSEIFAWPYFFALPLDALDRKQRVELFTLVTAGDYQDMKTFGAYIFYRAAITPDGRWLFFVAGD